MSKKSIFLSLLAIVLFAVMLLAVIYIFKSSFLMGLIGILLLGIPVFIQKKAIDEASGKIDTIIAKYVVPALAVVITLLAIMSLAVWIK